MAPPKPPPGAVTLSDLMPRHVARRIGTRAIVRWVIVAAYAVLLVVLLPSEIRHYHGSAWGLAGNIAASVLCSGIIVAGILTVVRRDVQRLAAGVHSWLEGSELVVSGAEAGRVDLASAEVALRWDRSNEPTVTPTGTGAPLLVAGPDRQGRRLRYHLGEPLTGILRPSADLLALAAVLDRADTTSGPRVAGRLRSLATDHPDSSA
jgi:hypothetical protein